MLSEVDRLDEKKCRIRSVTPEFAVRLFLIHKGFELLYGSLLLRELWGTEATSGVSINYVRLAEVMWHPQNHPINKCP